MSSTIPVKLNLLESNPIENSNASIVFDPKTDYSYRRGLLWMPAKKANISEGQLISQALLLVTASESLYATVHTMQAHFYRSVDSESNISYKTTRLFSSIPTHQVELYQNGVIAGVISITFQKPGSIYSTLRWPFPSGVSHPDKCFTLRRGTKKLEQATGGATAEERFEAWTDTEEDLAQDSLIETRISKRGWTESSFELQTWLRVKHMDENLATNVSFQQATLASMTDLETVGVPAEVSGLRRWASLSSKPGLPGCLNHRTSFLSDNFDCREWILCVVEATSSHPDPPVIHGRFYTQYGELVATTTQSAGIREGQVDQLLSKL